VSAITTTTATSVPSNTSTLPGTPSATSLSKTASAGLSSTRSPSVKPPASLQRTISSTGNASSGSMPPTPRATAPPSAGLSTPLGIGTRSVNSAGSGILTQTYGGTLDATSTTMASILPKRKLQELVTQIDPNERLDPDVEDVSFSIALTYVYS
jgi:transcription initiation factor TFIID subunit 12